MERALSNSKFCGVGVFVMATAFAVAAAGIPESAMEHANAEGICDEEVLLQSHLAMKEIAEKHETIGNTSALHDNVDASTRFENVKPIYNFHVAKCAGFSFMNALINLPGVCPTLPPGTHYDIHDVSDGSTDHLTQGYCPGIYVPESDGDGEFFLDHSGVGELYEKTVRGHGVTMLRQPEQRLISGFYDHQHSWPLWHYERDAANLREYAEVVSGCAVRMLTRDGVGRAYSHGATAECGSPVPATSEEIDLAVHRLQEGFVFVGIVEEWDLSICLLHAMYGGKCFPGDLGETHANEEKTTSLYDTSELEGFTDTADGILYKEAVRMFHSNLEKYNVSHSTCVPCFREAGRL